MKNVRPHDAFKYTRADEVAECWEGVPEWLYLKLWNDVVSVQRPTPNLEDSGPADHVGHECLAKHWRRLDLGSQVTLNKLAADRQEETLTLYR